MDNIDNIESVCWWEQIVWLVESDLDVEFYRVDKTRDNKEKIVNISKDEMRVAIEQNWEMRG